MEKSIFLIRPTLIKETVDTTKKTALHLDPVTTGWIFIDTGN